jgi:hypothetical protein
MPEHRIRHLIKSNFARTAADHIKRGDLKAYSTDGKYIYKNLTNEEHLSLMETDSDTPIIMQELGLKAEIDE